MCYSGSLDTSVLHRFDLRDIPEPNCSPDLLDLLALNSLPLHMQGPYAPLSFIFKL